MHFATLLWVFLLMDLIALAILGTALYGTVMGLVGVTLGILARRRNDQQPSTTRRDAIRCGRRALIAGGVGLAVLTTIGTVLELSDWRLLLIAEPALMFGVAAIVLARPRARPGISLVDLMGFVAWFGLAIAAPIELSALQLKRELGETIYYAHERLAFADEMMEMAYDHGVRTKYSSAHDYETRQQARRGLDDARTGLQAAERLAATTPKGPERRRLLGLRADFARQIKRYEKFVRELGEEP